MSPLAFVPYYIYWHYLKAPRQILHITATFLWFVWHFFSIGLLFRTLFSPWMRLQESKPSVFDIPAFFSTLLVNTVVRLFGALFRLVFISIGFLIEIGIIAASIVVLIVWITYPVVLIGLLLVGIRFIIQ